MCFKLQAIWNVYSMYIVSEVYHQFESTAEIDCDICFHLSVKASYIQAHKFSSIVGCTQVLSWHSILTVYIFYFWDKWRMIQLVKYKHTCFNHIWMMTRWLLYTGVFLYLKSGNLDRSVYLDFKLYYFLYYYF